MRQGFGLGVGAVALASLIWGAQFPIGKSAYSAIDPVSLNVARYVMSALLIAGVLAAREGVRAVSFEGQFVPLLAFGLIGMCFSPLLVFGGLVFARPEHAAIIISTQPAITALAHWWVRGARPSGASLACVGGAFAGAALVVTRGRLSIEGTAEELLGDALVAAGAVCWVAYTMLTERRSGFSTLRFTTLVLIGGLLGNLAALGIALGVGWLDFPSRAAWLSVAPEVLYLGLCGIFVAMTLWNFGTQRVGSLNALLFTNLIPVVTFAIGYAQGHRFELVEILGAALVVAALIANNLVERRRHAVLPLQ